MKKRFTKKRAGRQPCSKNCVDPIYPQFGFDLRWRGDAACARQGSSRDLDHQTLVLRPACPNIRRPVFCSCHHFRQRMFKIRAIYEMIGK
jgi:hypothetical protein